MTETTISTVIPVEEQITQELVKANVTEALIAGLKEKYLPLKINGIEDKETYLQVKEARKECKSLRVMAEKICKKGREEAVAIQKAWVAKEKEVAGQIGEVEDHLEKQEKEYEAEIEREKAERKRKQEEQFILRQQSLSGMGALYSDGNFSLGEVSFELSLIKECENDIWEESILPKFRTEYEKIEAERLEQERIKQEKEAELKRQQEELERKQRELEAKEAALKEAQEEQERKQREEFEKKAAEVKVALEAKTKSRCNQLSAIGLLPGFEDNHLYYKGYDCWVSHLDITGYDDEKWDKTIVELTQHVSKKKEELEQKRIEEIEAQKEVERKRVLGQTRFQMLKAVNVTTDEQNVLADMSEDDFTDYLTHATSDYENAQKEKWEKEQEEKRRAEELKKQLEMEQAKDKEKWEDILTQLSRLEIHEMRSGQYRKKAAILREKLDEIKAL